MVLVRVGKRVIRFFYEYSILIVILAFGLCLWTNIFDLAVIDFMESDIWRYRGAWLGNDEIDLFGYRVIFQFEGYTDHSFYYVHWGNNFLRGVTPYSGEFGSITLDGYSNQNGAYMFPPLTVYIYALGIALISEGWGIGLVLAAFAFLTVFPVYGLGKELANNRHVGEVAALTYLLNPNVIFHGLIIWMNPAPFMFFFFSGFYMLVTNRRQTGTILIVAGALFKQIAWFLGIPLVVYLLVKQTTKSGADNTEEETPEKEDEETSDTEETPETEDEETTDTEETPTPLNRIQAKLESLANALDLKAFAISVVVVACFGLAIIFPFLLANENLLRYWSLAAGSWPLSSFTELPSYGIPINLQILPVAAGVPWLAELLDLLVSYGFLMALGVFLFMGLMFLEPKHKGSMRHYFRRILFLTFLLMLWVHFTGPRGVFKYYFMIFAPFFSIFSSSKMITSKEENVGFSFSMLWLPMFLVFTYLIPSRNVYLFAVLLIFTGYAMAHQIGTLWSVMTAPGRYIRSKVGPRLMFITTRLRNAKTRFDIFLYPEKIEVLIEVPNSQ